jgi:hypothetical protein
MTRWVIRCTWVSSSVLLDVGFALKATTLLRCREMSLWARNGLVHCEKSAIFSPSAPMKLVTDLPIGA